MSLDERCTHKVYTNAKRALEADGLTLRDISPQSWAMLNNHAFELAARWMRIFGKQEAQK